MIVEINEQGFTADGKFRLLPVEADVSMYYAGANVGFSTPLVDNLSPKQAHNVWGEMVKAFSVENDYTGYMKV